MNGGLGFHNIEAPLGIRWWLSGQKIAIDAGIGFGSEENVAVDENLSHWALDFGVPMCVKSWDKVHFMVCPGIVYTSEEDVIDPGPPVVTDNSTAFSIGAELEAEVFLVDNFSVSASQGFAFVNTDPAVGQSTTDWGTTGSNFTHIGFHVYLFGGGQ